MYVLGVNDIANEYINTDQIPFMLHPLIKLLKLKKNELYILTTLITFRQFISAYVYFDF